MKKYIDFIKNNISRRSLHEQLAEECNELGQASLKAIRALGMSENITPVMPSEALYNLTDEVSDVLMVLSVIFSPETVKEMAGKIEKNPKWKRWSERQGYEEQE